MTGEPPKELKDYLFPRTGRLNRDGSAERLSLPTYSKDWVAWTTDPGKALLHKLHPMWGTVSEALILNEDYYGTEIRNANDHWMVNVGNTLAHFVKAFEPFSARNFQRMREAEEPAGLALLMAASGISSAPSYLTKTRAQKRASEILRDKMRRGARTREDAASARAKAALIRQLRKGEEPTKKDLELLSPEQIKGAIRDAKFTPFQALFNRLSFEEGLEVYELANEEERKQVEPLLIEKAKRAKNIEAGDMERLAALFQ